MKYERQSKLFLHLFCNQLTRCAIFLLVISYLLSQNTLKPVQTILSKSQSNQSRSMLLLKWWTYTLTAFCPKIFYAKINYYGRLHFIQNKLKSNWSHSVCPYTSRFRTIIFFPYIIILIKVMFSFKIFYILRTMSVLMRKISWSTVIKYLVFAIWGLKSLRLQKHFCLQVIFL